MAAVKHIVGLVGLFLAAGLAGCGSEAPKPSPPADSEMGASSAPIANAVDAATLARFRGEYDAAGRHTQAIFEKYLPLLGPGPMLTHLEQKFPACHPQAHDLGRALYALGGDVGDALVQCDHRCTSGCMHGVVSEAFGSATPAGIRTVMNAFCAEGEMARLHKPGNCAHGIGHALMFVAGGDPARALDGCLGFATGPLQYYCATGVFMEEFVDRMDSSSARGLTPRRCDSEVLFPGACYRYGVAYRLRALGEPGAVSDECLPLAPLQRRGCFHGLGYASMGEVYLDPQSLPHVCGKGDREDRLVCVEGVVEKLAEVHAGRAKAGCAFLDTGSRQPCEAAVARRMYAVDKPTFPLYYDAVAIARRQAELGRSTDRAREEPAHRH